MQSCVGIFFIYLLGGVTDGDFVYCTWQQVSPTRAVFTLTTSFILIQLYVITFSSVGCSHVIGVWARVRVTSERARVRNRTRLNSESRIETPVEAQRIVKCSRIYSSAEPSTVTAAFGEAVGESHASCGQASGQPGHARGEPWQKVGVPRARTISATSRSLCFASCARWMRA